MGSNQSFQALKARNAAVSLNGRLAMVVGGTAGIGKGAALRLAQAGASVTIVGRNAEEAKVCIQELKTKAGNQQAQFNFLPCDAFSLANIRQVCTNFSSSHPEGLDFLVLSQGMATLQGFTPTIDGIDQKLALHYYSRMAFIFLLLPLLNRKNGSRVLSVLSAGMHSPYSAYRTHPDLKDNYSLKNAADAAGFYNDLALDSLARENPSVSFIHFAPGFVSSNWGTELPLPLKGLTRATQAFGTSIIDHGEYSFELLTSPRFAQGSLHLAKSDLSEGAKTTLHEEAREFIFNHTREVFTRTGIISASSAAASVPSAAGASLSASSSSAAPAKSAEASVAH